MSEIRAKGLQHSSEVLSTLIPISHSLLCALGVSHPSLDRVVSIAKKYDVPAKLTGAGGGGCALVLLPDILPSTQLNGALAPENASSHHHTNNAGTRERSESNLIQELETAGFSAWHADVGCEGAHAYSIEAPFSSSLAARFLALPLAQFNAGSLGALSAALVQPGEVDKSKM